jgi:electron transport complex protein RnfE
MGIGFTIMLIIMGGEREILGNGSIFGISLYGSSISPALAMILPPGGFLAFGILIGTVNAFSKKKITAIGCTSCGAPYKKKYDSQEGEK